MKLSDSLNGEHVWNQCPRVEIDVLRQPGQPEGCVDRQHIRQRCLDRMGPLVISRVYHLTRLRMRSNGCGGMAVTNGQPVIAKQPNWKLARYLSELSHLQINFALRLGRFFFRCIV